MARRKCTPFGTFGTTFPPEGELLAVLCIEVLMSSEAGSRANLPLRGKSPQGNRGAFPSGVSPVVRFSIPRSGIIKLIAQRAIPPPFEPSAPFEPSEPSRRRRVHWRYHHPRPKGPSPLSTQPAAAGGHNLQPCRGWSPSPLNLLNLLNPLNPLNPGRRRRPYLCFTI